MTTALNGPIGAKLEAIPGRGDMTKTIHLLRHAQSAFNEAHTDGGPDPMLYDAPLSALGHEQVTEARRVLQTTPVPFGVGATVSIWMRGATTCRPSI